jgi:hypothetical protein
MKVSVLCLALALLSGSAARADNSCTPGEGSHADRLGGSDCRDRTDLCLHIAPNDQSLRNGESETFHLAYRLSIPGDAIVPGTGIVGVDWGDGTPPETFGPGTVALTHTFNKCQDTCNYTLHFAATQDFQYSGGFSCSYRGSAHQTAVVRVSQPNPPPVVASTVIAPAPQPASEPAGQRDSKKAPDTGKSPDAGAGSSSSSLVSIILAFVFGTVFVIVMLVIAHKKPNPEPFPRFVYRVVLSLAAGGVGAVIPGVFNFTSPLVSAGGALALFAIVYLVNPPERTSPKEPPK